MEEENGNKGKWKQVEANEQPGGLWKGKIMKLKTRPFVEITKLHLLK